MYALKAKYPTIQESVFNTGHKMLWLIETMEIEQTQVQWGPPGMPNGRGPKSELNYRRGNWSEVDLRGFGK